MAKTNEAAALTAEKTKAEDKALKAEKIRRSYANERINYIAVRPIGVSEKVKDVTVTVNGKNYRIMYNKPVKIPRFVAEVLDRAYNEAEKIDDRITELTKEARLIMEL